MNMVYGYIRISTKKQNLERQIRNIKAKYPAAVMIQETYTGTKFQGREEFEKLISKVKAGDTIVFDSVSRMSRNADEGFAIYQKLFNRGISLYFLKEPHIDTETYKRAIQSELFQLAVSIEDRDTDELIHGIFSALNKYIMSLAEKQIKIAFEQAEKEVEDLHQRTREGIATARLNGKQIGLAKGTKLVTRKSIRAKELIQKHNKDFGGTLSDKETMKLIGISRNTFYKYKRQL